MQTYQGVSARRVWLSVKGKNEGRKKKSRRKVLKLRVWGSKKSSEFVGGGLPVGVLTCGRLFFA